MTEQAVSAGELLTWYRDAGVDCALNDAPVNRFEETANTAQKSVQSAKPKLNRPQNPERPSAVSPTTNRVAHPPPAERSIPDANAVEKARELAASATSLSELKTAIEGFEGCNLKFTARSTVFSDGNAQAKLMLIGEVPGRDEDAQGVPFVGRSGQLLDKMLAAIGLDRTGVYISNIIPWRPPGNRTPSPAETEICLPFILKHIELAQPDLIVLLGGTPCKVLLKSRNGIMSIRGKWTNLEIAGREIATLPTLHPDYLIRTPSHKRMAWDDLLSIKAKLNEVEKSPPAEPITTH